MIPGEHLHFILNKGYRGNERILGDSDFVKKVLAQAKDNFERKYHLKSNGFNFEKVLGRVAELLDLKPEQVLAVGKYKKTVEIVEKMSIPTTKISLSCFRRWILD